MTKLEVGEEYLTISILGNQIKLTAFPNKEKTEAKQPDFKGDGVAVWISKKRAPQPKQDSPGSFNPFRR